jgi:site-specific recombinase XerD
LNGKEDGRRTLAHGRGQKEVFGWIHQRPSHRAETIAPSLNALVSGFLLARRAAGRTPSTIEWYDARLRRFAAFVGDPPASGVTAADVRRFLVAVKAGTGGRETADSYTEGHRKAIAALFTWAVGEGIVARAPTAGVPRFRCDRRLPTVLSRMDIDALLSSQKRTPTGIRNTTMLLLMFDTGIRVGELAATTVRDLDLERGELRVRGKSRRERMVPVGPAVRAVLFTYLARVRPAELFAGTDALFLGRHGRPITTNAIRQLVKRAKLRAGVTARVHPHAFRSSFATHYILNGGDPATCQTIMGIRSAQVFNGYVNVALSDVHAAHAKASPVERMLRGA